MSQSDRLYLEDTCSSLEQKLLQKLVDNKDSQEQDFQDFEVSYSISSDGPSLSLSVRYPFLAEALSNGSQALLERAWTGLPLGLQVNPGQLDIEVKTDSLGEDRAARERCAQQLLSTRIYLLTGPLIDRLIWLRDATASNKPNSTVVATAPVPPLLALQVRQLEHCWIIAKPDRVVVIFTIHLDDEVDVALGRAFCQEFAETGRKASDASLPCTFTEPKDPPADLRAVQLAFVPNVGFLSFTLSDQCVRNATEERLHALAQPVMTFRNFFNFHLKSAKSYLHSRLRKRLDGWQQAMNRARRAPKKGQDAKRRLMSGKEFAPAPRVG